LGVSAAAVDGCPAKVSCLWRKIRGFICRDLGFNGVVWFALDGRFGYDLYVAVTPSARALALESSAAHGEG